MKKKLKKMVERLYQESDICEHNIMEGKNLYDLVEKLQYRLDEMEDEHMILVNQYAKLETEVQLLKQHNDCRGLEEGDI